MNKSPIKKHLLSLSLICGGVIIFPAASMATVADGVYAYEKGNYEKARMEWLPYAALGNPNALYNLGQLHRMGRGVELSYSRAEEYYLRAAEKGHIGAQRNLGTLYYFGRLGKVDRNKAYSWLSKAAINGDASSQLMTGTMHFNGESVEKNNIQAYAWINLAAQKGVKNAKEALAKLNDVMTADQIAQAKALSPNLLSRQLSPDDVGLMVQPSDTVDSDIAELNASETPPVTTESKTKNTGEIETSSQQETTTDTPPFPTGGVEDNYRVQLGSFRNEPAAEEAISQLRKKFTDFLADKDTKIEFADLGIEKGVFFRLQLSPFALRSDAAAFCDRLKEYGQSCYVVKTP